MNGIRMVRAAWRAVFLLLLLPALTTAAEPRLTIHFFWASNCPHCAEEKPFLEDLQQRHPQLAIREYEIWTDREGFDLLRSVARASGYDTFSTPATVVGEQVWFGFSGSTADEIERAVDNCLTEGCADLVAKVRGPPRPAPPAAAEDASAVRLPLFGTLDPQSFSLPVFTILLGLLDSLNPCAFFVLLFLLSLLIHARSRKVMLLVGGTFVFFSGLIYFLFMAAWLNLFLLAGQMRFITAGAGLVALGIAVLNIKDFFFFKQGVSLSIPEKAKPRLFARMRSLLTATRISSVLLGAVVLAAAANTYELLCTAGFPMVYSRVLTLHDLPLWRYYLFLVLYNGVYVLPLLAIVLIFTVTLGSRKLSEWQGRVLKLVSGTMMGLLGLTLLLDPDLLNDALAALGLLVLALAASLLTAVLYRRFRGKTLQP